MISKRRTFIKQLSTLTAGAAALGGNPLLLNACNGNNGEWFRISLAQWSLHNYFRRWTRNGYTNATADPLDFPIIARNQFGIDAIEYVNQFYFESIDEPSTVRELKSRCDGEGVKSLLIMVDAEGRLGDPDDDARGKAVSNHVRWLEAAKALGCHSIRVNAASEGEWEEQMKLAADGLTRLSELAEGYALNVLVENHGGNSSNGQWLSEVMDMVDMENCGTLPDFGNWRIGGGESYDPYRGIAELMPYAKAVSAKSYNFDAEGNHIELDYRKIMQIVKDAGYRGYVGIEYEGNELSEFDGILATKALLEKVRAELA